MLAGPRSVLVVDDTVLVRKVVAAMLDVIGCEAEQAASGREALAILSSRSFDLVLVDVWMPELDGPATALRIAAEIVPCPRLVALTGDDGDASRERCRAAGFEGVLVKPVSLRELERVVGGGHPR